MILSSSQLLYVAPVVPNVTQMSLRTRTKKNVSIKIRIKRYTHDSFRHSFRHDVFRSSSDACLHKVIARVHAQHIGSQEHGARDKRSASER